MSILYQQLLHDTAIRLNALVGTQVATITATYDTAVLTAGDFKSADWPFASFRDAILMSEEDFAWTIADTANHPWRANLVSASPALSDGDDIPAFDTGGIKVIGAIGAVYDALDGTICLEGELDEIMRVRRLLTIGVLALPHYLYRIDAGRIRHTRTTVQMEVCIYDRNARQGAFIANSTMLLPDVLEGPIVARAVSLLTKETAFAEQAALYGKYADEAMIRIRNGLTSVVAKAVPIKTGDGAWA